MTVADPVLLGTPRRIALPEARGPLSERLFKALRGEPDGPLEPPPDVVERDRKKHDHGTLFDEDLQLALYVSYELHYADIGDVDPRWEWAPSLLRYQAPLQAALLDAVSLLVEPAAESELPNIGRALGEIVAADDGPPLSRYLETQGTREQLLEHVIHRSAYQLKEADPHSWAIPRLNGGPKVSLLEIQFDEYGSGRPERVHATLFANTMRGLGLDPSYGAYLQQIPAITLATVNLMSCFGLNRRLRGAIIGHLAAFEMTSSIPNRRYGNALRRLGYGPEVTDFYDEHVEADSIHDEIAAWDLAGGFARQEPELAASVLFGARALLAVEGLWAEHLLTAWQHAQSSLLRSGQADLGGAARLPA
jgi:hypothetical protein